MRRPASGEAVWSGFCNVTATPGSPMTVSHPYSSCICKSGDKAEGGRRPGGGYSRRSRSTAVNRSCHLMSISLFPKCTTQLGNRAYIDNLTTLYYILQVVFYDSDVKRAIKKGSLPRDVAKLFKTTFEVLDSTGDLNLFDIKQLTSNSEKIFYRLRKGKYRAIFILEDDDIYVLAISKRNEVYKKWP